MAVDEITVGRTPSIVTILCKRKDHGGEGRLAEPGQNEKVTDPSSLLF